MTVWMAMPSAAPVPQAKLCVMSWQKAGYKVAIACEDERLLGSEIRIQRREYKGYARAINRLADVIVEVDEDCQVIVAAGDDMFPDPNRRAAEIELEFVAHFNGTLGVMQPTGDRWTLGTADQPQSERVAGSPWLGREWCRRAYMGNGPLWDGYYHCFVDNDLAEVAAMHGVMAWWPHVTHRHEHYLRHGGAAPLHARVAYSHWDADKALFEERKVAGFPDSGLLE